MLTNSHIPICLTLVFTSHGRRIAAPTITIVRLFDKLEFSAEPGGGVRVLDKWHVMRYDKKKIAKGELYEKDSYAFPLPLCAADGLWVARCPK
jgi:hypothetical protein